MRWRRDDFDEEDRPEENDEPGEDELGDDEEWEYADEDGHFPSDTPGEWDDDLDHESSYELEDEGPRGTSVLQALEALAGTVLLAAVVIGALAFAAWMFITLFD